MNKKNNRVYAEIHLDAVEDNFENMYKNLTPGTKMIAVVKADAYGHGAVQIASLIQEKEYIWGFAALSFRRQRCRYFMPSGGRVRILS